MKLFKRFFSINLFIFLLLIFILLLNYLLANEIKVFRADYGDKEHVFKDFQKAHDNFMNRIFNLKPGEYNYRIGKARDTTERFKEEALKNYFLLGKHNKKNASENEYDVNLVPQHELANILPGYSRKDANKTEVIKSTVVNTTPEYLSKTKNS